MKLAILIEDASDERLKGSLIFACQKFLVNKGVIQAEKILNWADFELTLGENKVLTVSDGIDIHVAFEICCALKSQGYTDLILVHNDIEHKVKDEEI